MQKLKRGEYYNKSEVMKEKLNSISKSFCMAKWLQVSLHLPQGKTHSCYHPPAHKIPLEELKDNPGALHNTIEKKNERKLMLEGTKPKGCQFCWSAEDLDHTSDRHYRACEYFDMDWDWAEDKLKKISTSSYDYNVNPINVEVNFNQACNFKCMYCSPHLSTTWEKEIKEFGPYKMSGIDSNHNDIQYLDMPLKMSNEENPYVDAFWKWLPTIYKDLRTFRMTGGEPLIDTNTFKMLDYINKHPHPLLEVSITSNLCPPDQKMLYKFIDSVNKITKKQVKNKCIDVKFYVPNIDHPNPYERKRFIVKESCDDNILKKYPRISETNIHDTFNERGFDPDSGAYFYIENYTEIDGKFYPSNSKLALNQGKQFTLYISLDTVEEQAEYIRYGLNYNNLKRNVDTVLAQTEGVNISFINTFNILSLPKLKNFLQYILDLRTSNIKQDRQLIWFDIPYLEYPDWMNIQLINQPVYLNYIEDAILFMENNISISDNAENTEIQNTISPGFKLFEINKMKRNLEWAKQGTTNPKDKMINFYLFFKEYDRRKNLNFLKVFPELSKFYIDCKTQYELS